MSTKLATQRQADIWAAELADLRQQSTPKTIIGVFGSTGAPLLAPLALCAAAAPWAASWKHDTVVSRGALLPPSTDCAACTLHRCWRRLDHWLFWGRCGQVFDA